MVRAEFPGMPEGVLTEEGCVEGIRELFKA